MSMISWKTRKVTVDPDGQTGAASSSSAASSSGSASSSSLLKCPGRQATMNLHGQPHTQHCDYGCHPFCEANVASPWL